MLKFHQLGLGVGVVSVVLLTGCASVVNTAENAEYACPGMPLGVLCKTPAAVYRSTHADPAPTAFDTPIGTLDPSTTQSAHSLSGLPTNFAPITSRTTVSGPRPVREPAKVARIWIAPWVDKNDNLHLGQTQFTEIKPRTWTIGKAETQAGSGSVIPHRALERFESSSLVPETPRLNAPAISAKALEAAKDLIPPL